MSKQLKVLLVNPPSEQPCIRDYYCSFSSQASYYWPPQDLVLLSGTLKDITQVEYLDLQGQRLGAKEGLERIARNAYDAVVFTSGSLSLETDLLFIRMVKERLPQAKTIVSAAPFIFIGEQVIRQSPFLDGILLDFTNADLLYFLSREYDCIKNMFYRREDGGIILENRPLADSFSLPAPNHKLFLSGLHRMPPFVFGHKPFLTTIASTGCPFKCTFCVAGRVKYRYRELDNLIAELREMHSKLGVRNVFFADCHFLANPIRSSAICSELISNFSGTLNWICNSRIEPLLDEKMVISLSKAGCKMVMIGAESASSEMLDRYAKGLSAQDVEKAVRYCRRQGIYTLLYFILGLPGEDEISLRRTREFIDRTACDFISLSFAMPDFGTALRDVAIDAGLCDNELGGWDHTRIPYLKSTYSTDELIGIRKSIYRRFYFKPRRLLERAKDIRSLRFVDLEEGMRLLKSWW